MHFLKSFFRASRAFRKHNIVEAKAMLGKKRSQSRHATTNMLDTVIKREDSEDV